MNHKIKILIQNIDTAEEETIYLDSEIVNKKLVAFKAQVLDDAIKAVVEGTEGRQALREKNSQFVAKHGLKQ